MYKSKRKREGSFYQVFNFPPLRMVIRSLMVFLLITIVLFTISISHGKPTNNVNSLGLVIVAPESVLDSTHQNGKFTHENCFEMFLNISVRDNNADANNRCVQNTKKIRALQTRY